MTVIAICCSDIHLSHKAPIARTAEDNWYDVMKRPLLQLRDLANEYKAPIICAGDIFDKWGPTPELINFALTYLPHMYAIPGQHDLPHHSLEDIHKSAFWTLVKAKKITYLEPNKPLAIEGIQLWGFPFGTSLKPLGKTNGLPLEIAVIHSYIWTQKTGFPGASKDQRLASYISKLKGYHIAVFGDNHSGFLASKQEPKIINCGGFMRRKMDEIDYEPCVGLIHDDGTITRHKLDCTEDKFLDNKQIADVIMRGEGLLEFVEELSALGDAVIDFGEALERAVEKADVPKEVQQIVKKALEKGTS